MVEDPLRIEISFDLIFVLFLGLACRRAPDLVSYPSSTVVDPVLNKTFKVKPGCPTATEITVTVAENRIGGIDS